MNEYRTHNCGELRIENVGQEVRLAGWVQRIRNLGKMKFIDLRDEFGITQIIISDDGSKDATQQVIESIGDKRIRYVKNTGTHGFTHNFENALRLEYMRSIVTIRK